MCVCAFVCVGVCVSHVHVYVLSLGKNDHAGDSGNQKTYYF